MYNVFMQANNDTRQIQIRKYENALIISGMGVIAFGLWSIVKTAAYFVFDPANVQKAVQAFNIEESADYTSAIGPIVLVGIFFALVFDLMLRVYVGRSAIRQARGRGNRIFSVIVAIILALLLINEMVYRIWMMLMGESISTSLDGILVSWIIDMTSFLAMVEVIYSSIRLQRLRREAESQQKEAGC